MTPSSDEQSRRFRPFRWEHTREGYVAEWPGILVLRTTAEGDVLEVTIAPGAPADAVEKVRQGAAVAFARAIAGKSSLHASAVARDGTALLFVGPSGAGKSSVAKALCEGGGSYLLADDVTVVDEIAGRWRASPSETSVWLSPGAHPESGPKIAIPCALASSPAEVRCIVQLSFDDKVDAPRLVGLKGGDAAAALLSAFMRFDPNPDSMRRELALVAAIMAKTDIARIVRPRTATLEATARAILNGTRDLGTLPMARAK